MDEELVPRDEWLRLVGAGKFWFVRQSLRDAFQSVVRDLRLRESESHELKGVSADLMEEIESLCLGGVGDPEVYVEPFGCDYESRWASVFDILKDANYYLVCGGRLRAACREAPELLDMLCRQRNRLAAKVGRLRSIVLKLKEAAVIPDLSAFEPSKIERSSKTNDIAAAVAELSQPHIDGNEYTLTVHQKNGVTLTFCFVSGHETIGSICLRSVSCSGSPAAVSP